MRVCPHVLDFRKRTRHEFPRARRSNQRFSLSIHLLISFPVHSAHTVSCGVVLTTSTKHLLSSFSLSLSLSFSRSASHFQFLASQIYKESIDKQVVVCVLCLLPFAGFVSAKEIILQIVSSSSIFISSFVLCHTHHKHISYYLNFSLSLAPSPFLEPFLLLIVSVLTHNLHDFVTFVFRLEEREQSI